MNHHHSFPPINSDSGIWYFCSIAEGLQEFGASQIEAECMRISGRRPNTLFGAPATCPRNVVVFWFPQSDDGKSSNAASPFITRAELDALLSIRCVDFICVSIFRFAAPASEERRQQALIRRDNEKKPALDDIPQQVAAAKLLMQSRIASETAFPAQLRLIVANSIRVLHLVDPHPEQRLAQVQKLQQEQMQSAGLERKSEQSAASDASLSSSHATTRCFVPPLLLWRATGERLDKYSMFTRQDMAVALAEIIGTAAEEFGDFAKQRNEAATATAAAAAQREQPAWPWDVAMRHFHVEFLVVADIGDTLFAGLVLHGPNYPRLLVKSLPLFRQSLSMELTRQVDAHRLAQLKAQQLAVPALPSVAPASAAASASAPASSAPIITGAEFQTGTGQAAEATPCPPPSMSRDDIRIAKSDTCNMQAGIAELMLSTLLCAGGGQSLADDIIVDPFAGGGTLLMEAIVRGCSKRANRVSSAGVPLLAFGGDIELADAQMQRMNFGKELFVEALSSVMPHYMRTNSNGDADAATPTRQLVSSLRCGIQRCNAMCWDARRLPLRSNVVDAIVSDMPFGQRCSNRSANRRLYKSFFREAHRILRPGGCSRCVLLTIERALMLELIASEKIQGRDESARDDEAGAKESRDKLEQREQTQNDVVPVARRPRNNSGEDDDNNQKSNVPADSDDKDAVPLFTLAQPEIEIDMNGMRPFLFVLRRNDG